MGYQALGLDMDGTVLSSEKIITPRTFEAMQRALEAGKHVFFATGRCPSEVREHLDRFPNMRYVMCLSGALVLDVKENRILHEATLPRSVTEQVLAAARQVDAMVSVYAGDDVFVERRERPNMDYYNCTCFAPLYDHCAVWVDDITEALERQPRRIHKVNIYCHTPEDWHRAGQLLQPLPVAYAQGIPNNFEVSPKGMDKGVGLEMLCRAMGISMEEAIAVGDEGNDLAMVRAAGLGVAMGNASEAVKAAADVITGDCDHDGVADVIDIYLLAE